MENAASTVFSRQGDILQIELPSRLDASNASAVSFEIERHTDSQVNGIRINAKNLRSITADGLDVILDLKKKYRNISMDHAKMGIYDTLEEYGFPFFVNVEKEYRFVSVKDCKIIGHGSHGIIYKVGEDTIVKVYRDNSTLETIENERRYARNAFINGIPTAIAYDVVKTEYGYGVMFEMLDGTTLGKYLKAHPEDWEKYSAQFADLLYKLNTTSADSELYKDFHDVYLERAENAKKFLSNDDAETLKRIIRSIPRGGEMIHGDYHPNNVMVDSTGELMLIDMADISRGNGFFDIGGSFLLMGFLTKIPLLKLITEKITSVDPKTCRKMWDVLVRKYYKTDDEEMLKSYAKQFQAFSQLRIAASLGMNSSRKPFVSKLMTWYTRKIVIPKADKYIRLLSSANSPKG